ncbi:neural proliferation differentiation and control protein 1a [Misgurnus anguillicaudatus]|uniref:neural proliferation differentiation and control protein 1a n=1 Tax=Misgurnus anguillicaudatus TaxID=75329 RepID=UPI003CCF9E1E
MLFFLRARASLWLPGVLLYVCAILAAVGASIPAKKCPDHIDCARMGRHFCKPGSSHCGACLSPLEEDEVGHCVARRRHKQHHLELSRTEVDEEIDFLSSVIAKQQTSKVKPSGSDLQNPSESRPNNGSHFTTAKPTQQTLKPPKSLTDSSNRHGPIVSPNSSRDGMLVLMISLTVILGTIAFILAAVCWVRSQKETYLAQKVDYPAFQTTGANNNHPSSGDNTLAHSAQMYHYQHQKQQMMSMERKKSEPKVSESGATSDEENEEGDFTVYECPGLAPTGEMEVKNPLFDDSTLNSQRNHK